MAKATMIPLSDLDLGNFEERELNDRSNVAADIAAVIASGEGCAIEWTSAQLSQAKNWVAENPGLVTLSQLGNKSSSKRTYKNGKEVEIERFKRELIAIRPTPVPENTEQ